MPRSLSALVSPILCSVLLLPLSLAPTAIAQTQAATLPPGYVKVDAPLAQKLLLEAKATHPELKKIGLHSIPPGEDHSVIIANPIASKIGKPSSANDLTVVTTNSPKVYRHAEEGGFFDLGLPMFDADHRPIGMMVMEIPYKNAASPEAALSLGEKIRDEVAAKIPDKQALFR